MGLLSSYDVVHSLQQTASMYDVVHKPDEPVFYDVLDAPDTPDTPASATKPRK